MKLARTAIVAACLMVAGTAFADPLSTATLGSLKVTLIDLDPNDGIAPSITFMPDPRKYYDGAYISVQAQTRTFEDKFDDMRNEKLKRQSAWGSANIGGSVHTDTTVASASVTAAPDGFGFNAINASGTAVETAGYGSYYYATGGVPNTGLRQFTLSANTQVVFSVDVSLSVASGVGTISGEWRHEMAFAGMSLYVDGLAADGETEVIDWQKRKLSVGYLGDVLSGGSSDSWSGMVSASFSNLGSQSTIGGYAAFGAAEGASVLTAVPEPATYGMLLGGLGLIGALARRRSAAA